MADGVIPFDMVEDDVSHSIGIPSQSGVIPFDSVEDDTIPMGDAAGIRNAAVRGLGNAIGFAGEFAPTMEKGSVFAPRLFGLSEYFGAKQPEVSPADSGTILKGLAREQGAFDETKPESWLGQLGADVVEQGLSASAFGPAAIMSSAVTSGPGASVGRYFGGETGATIGSVASPFALAGLKTAVTKAGPTIAHMLPLPQSVKQAATNQAVGGLLRGSVDDPAAVEAALLQAKPSAFRTTAEVADSRSLAALEDAARPINPDVLGGIPEARSAARSEDVLGDLRDMNLYERSKELESNLLTSSQNVTKAVKDKWGLLDREQELLPDIVEGSLASKISDITMKGDRELPADARGLLNEWDRIKSDVTSVGKIQDFRSQVLEEGRAFKNQLDRNPTNADRLNYKVTSALQKHLDDVLDANVDAEIVTGSNADILRAARTATREQMEAFVPRTGVKSVATKAALNATDLKDTKAAQEIISSPDLMAAQLKAGDLGGVDLRPQMQEILLSSLPKSQSKWADYVAKHELQFGLAFNGNPEKVAAALEDIALESRKNQLTKSVFGGQSATDPRRIAGDKIRSAKGLSALPGWVQEGSGVGGAIYGGQEGYRAGETFPEKVALGLLGAGAGYATGKVAGGGLRRSSEAFDASLVDALRNPASGLARLQEAKPGLFSRNVSKALSSGQLGQGAARGIGNQFKGTDLGSIGLKNLRAPEVEQEQEFNTEDRDMAVNPIVSQFEGGQRLNAYAPPAKGSGVTVGTGIDLGQRSLSELKQLDLPKTLIDKVKPYLGKKDLEATEYLNSNPLELTQGEADELDSAIGNDISKKISLKYSEDTGQDLSALPEEARTVVESLAYNFGPNLDEKLPTLWKHVVNSDWQGVHDFLISTKWKQPELSGRRYQEAALLNPLLDQEEA